MDLSVFAEPWEHVRLLSDPHRNAVLLELLQRHAPGRRVLEVGCGVGLWACAAAKLGATRVVALEPTDQWRTARALVRANHLQDVVEIVPCKVEDAEPEPVDLVFSELLNADPFEERVVEAMGAAGAWLAPGGRMAPDLLRVQMALVQADQSAWEHRGATEEVHQLGERLGLDVRPVLDELDSVGPYRYVTADVALAGPAVTVIERPLGADPHPRLDVTLELTGRGPFSGVVVWFEGRYDHDLWMDNAPGAAGHWGNLVCTWARPVRGPKVRVRVTLGRHGLEVMPVAR